MGHPDFKKGVVRSSVKSPLLFIGALTRVGKLSFEKRDRAISGSLNRGNGDAPLRHFWANGKVQFAAYKQFCDDTTVEKQRAIKEATAKMEQLVLSSLASNK